MSEAQSSSPPPIVAPLLPDDDDDDDAEQEFLVRKRIAVLGARGVGKTAVSIQCAMNRFVSDYMLTFEDTYKWKPVVDGTHYDISIVDTAGQDENSFFGLHYSIGVDGYILMFSVCDESSFDVIKVVNEKLLDTLNVINRRGTSELPRMLVGNQIDRTGERRVPFTVAQQYADEQGIPYLETSALSAHNVANAFTEILRIIQRNLRNSHSARPTSNRSEKKNQEAKQSSNFCLVQ